jgi:hypothetical protein
VSPAASLASFQFSFNGPPLAGAATGLVVMATAMGGVAAAAAAATVPTAAAGLLVVTITLHHKKADARDDGEDRDHEHGDGRSAERPAVGLNALRPGMEPMPSSLNENTALQIVAGNLRRSLYFANAPCLRPRGRFLSVSSEARHEHSLLLFAGK